MSNAETSTATAANSRGTSTGCALDRVEGRQKVTGAAHYTAEIPLPDLVYGVIVQSAIANGRIVALDAHVAETAPGVLAVITHQNAPPLSADTPPGTDAMSSNVPVLQRDRITYHGQGIAVVVARTLEQAQYAAMLLKVTYQQEPPAVELQANLNAAYTPHELYPAFNPVDSRRGEPEQAWDTADVRLDATYTTPMEHHNPLEASATIATWDGDTLTLYDATQNVYGVRTSVSNTLGIPQERVRVITHYVGGGFGCKSPVWDHVLLAVIAARHVGRPVKIALTRKQMFTGVGYRSQTRQRVRLGARPDGQLTALLHETITPTSMVNGYFIECAGVGSREVYACPNVLVTHRCVHLNLGPATMMRAPGHASGAFAAESAIDELAFALGIDPIALRQRNDSATSPESGRTWSSKSLAECFRQGAARFGWEHRSAEPRSMRSGPWFVGYGVATAAYPTMVGPASARARFLADGSARVESATHEIGQGVSTIMTQIAADALGLAPQQVRFVLGDTALPRTMGVGGSWTSASVGSAVHEACAAARTKLFALVRADRASPLYGYDDTELELRDGRVVANAAPALSESYAEVLARHGLHELVAEVDAQPSSTAQQWAMHAWGAQFAEVHIHQDTCDVRIARFLGVYGAGRILNPKLARSQMLGAIVGGIGAALHEETVIDGRDGHIVNASLGEYHVPVNADIRHIDALFVEEHDLHVNPLGVKGIGELGIVGVAAAIANAVFHATGVRVRDLPITLDKLL